MRRSSLNRRNLELATQTGVETYNIGVTACRFSAASALGHSSRRPFFAPPMTAQSRSDVRPSIRQRPPVTALERWPGSHANRPPESTVESAHCTLTGRRLARLAAVAGDVAAHGRVTPSEAIAQGYRLNLNNKFPSMTLVP